MTSKQARSLMRGGITQPHGLWADIGAGTGTFTLALQEILDSGTIYAVDKNPHALWNLSSTKTVRIEVVEGDFHHPLDLPLLDGMIMANALHYAAQPVEVLQHLVQYLKPDSPFVLIEYETRQALPPWIPHPIPFARFQKIAEECGLTEPIRIGEAPSRYGHDHIYSAWVKKRESFKEYVL